jgi:hypothetical protein
MSSNHQHISAERLHTFVELERIVGFGQFDLLELVRDVTPLKPNLPSGSGVMDARSGGRDPGSPSRA